MSGVTQIRRYLREMYPPLPRLVLSIIWFYAAYLGLAAYYAEPVQLVGPVPSVGALTYFFVFLFLRLSDELKDVEADRVHFPDRVIPSGRVSMAWVRRMWIGSLAAVFLLQVPIGTLTPAFLVLVGWTLLMYRYFFLRRWIAPSLVLAFVTHNPVGLLLNLYGVSLFAEMTGRPTLHPYHLGIAVFLWLPTAVWEVARKIRAPAQETSYSTYSKILGPRGAAFAVAGVAALFAGIGLVLAGGAGLGLPGRVGLVVAAGAFVGRCLWFAASPRAERAALRTPAEAWALISMAVWCLDLLLVHSGLWRMP